MRDKLAVCAAAGAAVILTTISCVLDIIIAGRIDDSPQLRALLYAAAALQIIALAVILYFNHTFFVQKKDTKAHVSWIDPFTGAGFNAIALLVTGVGIICFTSKYGAGLLEDFRLSAIGLTAWTLSIFSHGGFFALVSSKTHGQVDTTAPKVMVTKLGANHASQKELVSDARSSYYSKEATMASRSCTPTSPQTQSVHSSVTKTPVRSKYGRHSAKSSLDTPPMPTGDISVLSTAFERHDVLNVDAEARTVVINSSPTITRSGLETIPGSRPTSSGDTLTQEVMRSTPPKVRKQVQTTPEKVKPLSKNPSPNPNSSSPPNFSRPTSRNRHKATMSGSVNPLPLRSPRPSASMTDLIHPLFRPDSPSPPQILTSGTMVTASPLANQPITPKTLSRLRSASDLRRKPSVPSIPTEMMPGSPISNIVSPGQWRVMPPIESSPQSQSVLRQRSKSHASLTQRPTTAASTSMSLTTAETRDTYDGGASMVPTQASSEPDVVTMGSPGPSIIEEDELPPILPGFILSAGSRMSLVGYGKRKSVKREKPKDSIA